MVARRRRNTLLTSWAPLAKSVEQGSTCRVLGDPCIKEELRRAMGTFVRCCRLLELLGVEELEGRRSGRPGQ